MTVKRLLISIAWCTLIILTPITINAQTKIDPFFDSLGSKSIASETKSLSLNLNSDERKTQISDVFIKTSDVESTRESIREMGGAVHTTAGDVITATIDTNLLNSIADMDEVEFIEAAKPIQLDNDVAKLEVNSGEVHQGINLPSSYSGSGVIIGIIDTGIDYTHPDFYDDAGQSRILAIWNQNKHGGPTPSEIEDSYGTECDETSITDGSCPLKDTDGHGTHVAGTAAGKDSAYGGVAPDANIIVVSYDSTVDMESGYADTIFSTKICQAAYYIFKKADAYGMPAVINLSLGTHLGAHDGTSLFEQCLAGLVEGSAGKALVAAAGNEYSTDVKYSGIHSGFDLDGGTIATNFVIRKISNDRIYYVDFWGEPGSDLSVGLAIHEGSPSGTPLKFSGLIDPGSKSTGSFLNDQVDYSINYTETESVLNGKPHVGIRIVLNPTVTKMSDYSFDLVVSGHGSFDAWVFPDKPSKTIQFTDTSGSFVDNWRHVPGDRVKSIAIPATSPSIVAVTGYTSRNQWDKGAGCCEVSFALGELLNFSSSGPSATPEWTGHKPEIAAPGGMVASALSSYSQQNDMLIMSDGKHVLQAGTSMAAPFVSGTIALMFSSNPNFTQDDVKNYLIQSAYVDEAVGTVPHDRWGYGKLDVLAAVETAVNGGASGHFDRNPSINQPQEDSSGGGVDSGGSKGCSLSTKQSADMNLIITITSIFIISLITIAMKRRKILHTS